MSLKRARPKGRIALSNSTAWEGASMQAVKQPVTSSNIGKLRLRRSINPFLASVPISYPPPKHQKTFGVFRRYKMGRLVKNGLKMLPFSDDLRLIMFTDICLDVLQNRNRQLFCRRDNSQGLIWKYVPRLPRKLNQIQTPFSFVRSGKLVPVGYGIKKLQINCVIEDDKVSAHIAVDENEITIS